MMNIVGMDNRTTLTKMGKGEWEVRGGKEHEWEGGDVGRKRRARQQLKQA